MKDIVKTKYGKIDLNKLTKPVIELAMKKAEEYKRNLLAKYKKEEKQAKTWKELEKLDRKWDRIIENVYDTSLVDDGVAKYVLDGIPCDDDSIIKYMARRHLFMKPDIGEKIIVEAYNEYYDIGLKCEYCGKMFTAKRRGRKAKYCSESCKQMAYRKRKKKQSIECLRNS